MMNYYPFFRLQLQLRARKHFTSRTVLTSHLSLKWLNISPKKLNKVHVMAFVFRTL